MRGHMLGIFVDAWDVMSFVGDLDYLVFAYFGFDLYAWGGIY